MNATVCTKLLSWYFYDSNIVILKTRIVGEIVICISTLFQIYFLKTVDSPKGLEKVQMGFYKSHMRK